MRIKAVLTAMSLAFAITLVLSPETTSAAPKCNVANCKEVGSHSRAQIKEICQSTGGIETGTDAESGGYGCYGDDKDDSFIECDAKGKCIGGSKSSRGGKRFPLQKGPLQGGSTPPARK